MSEGTHFSAEVRVRAVRAVQDGMPRKAVATAYGIGRTTLYQWMQKHAADGQAGLERKAGSGRRRKLEELCEDELRALVLQGAQYYGYETDLWTVGRLRRVITEEHSIELSKNTVWRRLRDAGLTYQKPEREYYEIDEEARKKWLRYEVPKIRRCVKKHRGILYFQDESNVSLTAFLGKTWAPCGETPKSDRQAGGDCRKFGHQPRRASLVSSVGKTYRLEGSYRVSRANAQASSSPSLGSCHGPSTSAHVQDDESMDRNSATSPRLPSSEILARLESR